MIMPNHLHLLWKIEKSHQREDVQRDFLKFTAQKIRYDLKAYPPKVIEKFRVDTKDPV